MTARLDDITQAVLAHEDVARHMGEPGAQAQVDAYLRELRTTQRHGLYRSLRFPLRLILRTVERHVEHAERVDPALAAGHIVYVSNHKSHLDYLVELLVLDTVGIRPPLIAAGINLFGGALGVLNRQITGAIPIRRGSKDPVYLATLKAYVAEILKRRDLLYYAEGGRSYTGELKSPKTGLLQAALLAERESLFVVPMAISYDLVLEDKFLVGQALKGQKRPFSREVADMLRDARGYETRAFITFGHPIPLREYDPAARRDLVTLAHRIQREVGLLHKVLPTHLVARDLDPGMTRAELAQSIDTSIGLLREAGANLAVATGAEAVEDGARRLIGRGILVADGDRLRVRDRLALRYYGRALHHLLPDRSPTL